MTEVDALLAALDAAKDDAERAALIDAAPPQVRKRLNAALVYRRVIYGTPAEAAAERAYGEFTERLTAAVDDAARVRLIDAARADPQRGPAWLAEWSWRRTATSDEVMKRYFAALGAESYGGIN